MAVPMARAVPGKVVIPVVVPAGSALAGSSLEPAAEPVAATTVRAVVVCWVVEAEWLAETVSETAAGTAEEMVAVRLIATQELDSLAARKAAGPARLDRRWVAAASLAAARAAGFASAAGCEERLDWARAPDFAATSAAVCKVTIPTGDPFRIRTIPARASSHKTA